MSGLGLLGKLKQRRGDAKLEYEWGSSKVLQTLDLDKLPRLSRAARGPELYTYEDPHKPSLQRAAMTARAQSRDHR